MAGATDLSTTSPLPSNSQFNLKMQGVLAAGVYALSFGVSHTQAGLPLLETKPMAVFLAGLILVPLVVGYPLALVKQTMARSSRSESGAAAFVPFAQVALYGLAALLVWVATREAHGFFFG